MNDLPFTIAVHGGAGRLSDRRLEPAEREGYEAGLARALEAGEQLLARGESAVEAVTAAVSVLEDDPRFNAGRGAALCRDGKAELSASVMEGSQGAAGAVAGVRRIRNPVRAARALLDHSHVLVVGRDADRLATELGLMTASLQWFITGQRLAQWERYRRHDRMVLDHEEDGDGEDGDGSDVHEPPSGTVGAVARDRRGCLAAATSTGGLVNQLPGRVGDSPVIGAGTWATNGVCAISATGTGEAFLRLAVARRIADLIELGGREILAAGEEALAEVSRLGGEGGCLILDARGQIHMPFTSAHLLRGWLREGERPRVAIRPGEEIVRAPSSD